MKLILHMLAGVAIFWMVLIFVFLAVIGASWFANTFGPVYELLASFSLFGASIGATAYHIKNS